MKKRLTLFLIGMLVSVCTAFAQSKISGTVVSQEDGEPVIGASVKIVGTQQDMMADIMEVNPDNSPVSIPLPELFHLD